MGGPSVHAGGMGANLPPFPLSSASRMASRPGQASRFAIQFRGR